MYCWPVVDQFAAICGFDANPAVHSWNATSTAFWAAVARSRSAVSPPSRREHPEGSL